MGNVEMVTCESNVVVNAVQVIICGAGGLKGTVDAAMKLLVLETFRKTDFSISGRQNSSPSTLPRGGYTRLKLFSAESTAMAQFWCCCATCPAVRWLNVTRI